ncbi:MAG TPA: VWA-like domain-containing protein [Ktedonobacteraceae bacterium]|nr:VWA-like domain-containing protein [Ktedonobacteraceae bacterium]
MADAEPIKTIDGEQEEVFERQVSAAILRLRDHSPFFATLALFARMIPTLTLDTAATDGRDVYINPSFWGRLTRDERLGVMAHEVLHAALLHVPRRGKRDPLLWNLAADVVVNGVILGQPDFTLPKGHVRNRELEHLSVEEVYHKLMIEPDLRSQLRLAFADLLEGATRDGKSIDQAAAELEQHWRQALQQARVLSDMVGQGTMPAGLDREMARLNPSRLDWRSYLWRFLVQTPTNFEGFDRRFVGQGLYLDALAGEKLRAFVAVDTSGSIDQKCMGEFLSEVLAILGAYPHLEAALYYVDAACYGPYELTADTRLPKPKGGGGTDFRPFFEIVERELDVFAPGVCIYLTDGYGTFPDHAPQIPTLWVLSPGGISEKAVPFGEAIRLIPA